MTFEEYAEALNDHADKCEQCDAARKISRTGGCCADGQKIVAEWEISPKSKEDVRLESLNELMTMLEEEGVKL